MFVLMSLKMFVFIPRSQYHLSIVRSHEQCEPPISDTGSQNSSGVRRLTSTVTFGNVMGLRDQYNIC